jgi:DHA2 family multidrug resistance protein-like MFS transporter
VSQSAATAPSFIPSSSDDQELDGLPIPRRYIAMFAILASIIMAVLDGSIVNIALPTIATDLGASNADTVWVVNAYAVSLVISLIPLAALSESIGYRKVFVSGVVLFTIASLACALSTSLWMLVGARFLQGFGASGILCISAGLMRYTYPAKQLGKAIGINALVVALGSAAGPSLGTGILSIASWPWLFAINLPIGIVVLVASRSLPSVRGIKREIDKGSALLNAAMFGLIILAVDRLGSQPEIAVPMLIVAIACAVLLIRRESGREHPLIPLDLLQSPTFRQTLMASTFAFAAQMLSFVSLPFFLEHTLGYSPFRSGLFITPWPLAIALMATFIARLTDRIRPLILCSIGMTVLATGLLAMAAFPLADTIWPIIPFMVICGVGFGLFQVPNNRVMLTSAPKTRSGAAGGAQASARQFGQALGGAIMAVLFTISDTNAPKMALIAAAVLAATASTISYLNSRDVILFSRGAKRAPASP